MDGYVLWFFTFDLLFLILCLKLCSKGALALVPAHSSLFTMIHTRSQKTAENAWHRLSDSLKLMIRSLKQPIVELFYCKCLHFEWIEWFKMMTKGQIGTFYEKKMFLNEYFAFLRFKWMMHWSIEVNSIEIILWNDSWCSWFWPPEIER